MTAKAYVFWLIYCFLIGFGWFLWINKAKIEGYF